MRVVKLLLVLGVVMSFVTCADAPPSPAQSDVREGHPALAIVATPCGRYLLHSVLTQRITLLNTWAQVYRHSGRYIGIVPDGS
jgi:hypothetical protein